VNGDGLRLSQMAGSNDFSAIETFYEGMHEGAKVGQIIYGAHGCSGAVQNVCLYTSVRARSSLRTPIAEMIGKMSPIYCLIFGDQDKISFRRPIENVQDGADIRHMHADDC